MFILGWIAIILELYLISGILVRNAKSRVGYNRMTGQLFVKDGIESFSYELNPQHAPLDSDAYHRVVKCMSEHPVAKMEVILNEAHTNVTFVQRLIEQGVLNRVANPISRKGLVVKIAFMLLIVFAFVLADYFWLIQTNLRNFGLVFYLFLLAGTFIYYVFSMFRFQKSSKVKVYYILFTVFSFSILFYGVFGGRVFLHAQDYSDLISVSEAEFSEEINTVDITTLPVVDKSYGAKLGSIKLGEYPAIGSEFEAGEYSDILFNGVQYLVAPLEYRGFFKWLSNKDHGSPGYIMINKITSETTLVIFDADEPGMKYIPSSYFDNQLERYAYFHGMAQYRLASQYFEIDDEGNPYYVLSYTLPTIFVNGGWDIAKVAVVNARTGEVGIYDPLEVPSWVESVYPESIFIQQLNYWGALQEGWLNSFLAQKGVLQASSGTRVVTVDGRLKYFTGLTSAGSDESTVGFVYMDTKTKETTLFYFPGATEYAAMDKTITLLPQNNITASFPIPINVEGVPTYFILIKGDDGRILRNVFMSVENLEIYGLAETKTESYNLYLRSLSSTIDIDLVEITGTIDSIQSYVSDGNTVYWIQIDSDYYLLDVSSFDIEDMQYFISKGVGDEITIRVQNAIIVELVKPTP